MPKLSLMIARFPFFNQENPDLTDWLVETVVRLKTDPRFTSVISPQIAREKVDDTPITVSRNRVVQTAQKLGVDLLLMLDSDIVPDIGLWPTRPIAGAKPFMDTALDFMIQHNGPCVVAAPYCGPPPNEWVYVFQANRMESDNPNFDFRLEMIDRADAARRSGIEAVPAIATGLMLIDMRAFEQMRHPYYDYEYKDDGPQCVSCGHRIPGPRAARASTEDVYASRNAWLAGVPHYCLWDSWAGHWKRKLVGKPAPLHLDQVASQYVEAIVSGRRTDEKLLFRDGVTQPAPFPWLGGNQTLPRKVLVADPRLDAADAGSNLAPDAGPLTPFMTLDEMMARGGVVSAPLPASLGVDPRFIPGLAPLPATTSVDPRFLSGPTRDPGDEDSL